MNRLLTCLFTICVCLLPCGQAQARRVVYVVAVGNNAAPAGDERLEPLHYADDDAVNWLRLLTNAPERTTLLALLDAQTHRRHPELARTSQTPTYANLRSTLANYHDDMKRGRARGDTPVLFLTFSGHATVDELGQAALALLDMPLTRARLFGELLPLTELAETHLIIDACRAASVVGLRGPFDVELEGALSPLSEASTQALIEAHSLRAFPQVGALVASSADEQAHEWSRIEAGVFSHEVLSALRGAGDVNGDLEIAYSEVGAFVAAANRDLRDPRARPHMVAHVPGNRQDATLLALSDLPGTRLLHGRGATLGRFSIELDNGEQLLDAHVTADMRVVMALPSASTIYVRQGSREAEVSPGSSALPFDRLVFRSRTMAERGGVEHQLRDSLFRTAYGPAYYRGYVDSRGIVGVAFGTPTLIADDHVSFTPLRRRRLSFAAGALAIGALIASATSVGLALHSKRAFDETHYERRANVLRDAYRRRLGAAIGTGACALVLGAGSFWLWPSWSPAERGRGEAGLTLDARF